MEESSLTAVTYQSCSASTKFWQDFNNIVIELRLLASVSQ